MLSTHDALYTPPVGRGINADDLQAAQLAQLDEALNKELPAVLEYGTLVYVEELRQEERMKALDKKLAESLSPEHSKRSRDVFRQRAIEILKAEAAALAQSKKADQSTQAVPEAVTQVQTEKRQNARR